MQELFFQFAGVSITISIFIVILLLISPITNERYRVKWRYYIWLFLAFRLIIPIDFGVTEPPVEIDIPNIGIHYSVNDIGRQVPSAPAPEAEISGENTFSENGESSGEAEILREGTPPPAQAPYPLTISRMLTILYFAGAGIFLMAQFILYLSFRQSTKRWYQKVENLQVLEFFDRLKADMGMEKSLDIKVCKKISSPMITGLIRPTLLLPHDRYEGIDLELILKHEFTHFMKNDLWFKLLLIFANAAHWFNPVIYLMVRNANKDIEMACDEEVLKDSPAVVRERYTERILELMKLADPYNAPVSTSFHGGKNMMKARIRSILDMRQKKKGIIAISLIIVAVLLGSACKVQAMGRFNIPLTENYMNGYESQSDGAQTNGLRDFIVGTSFDMDRDGTEETKFLLESNIQGQACYLVYQKEWRKLDVVRIFEDIEPGVDYGLQAGNMEDLNTINILVSMSREATPFDGGYWELHTWKDGKFRKESLEPVKEDLKVHIISEEEAGNNYLGADTIVNVENGNEYADGGPVAALYFESQWTGGKKPKTVYYVPLSRYDAEGYETWKQDAVNKNMIGMRLVEDRPGGKVLLETKEVVYISMPNPVAVITSLYEYKNGEWNYLDGEIR